MSRDRYSAIMMVPCSMDNSMSIQDWSNNFKWWVTKCQATHGGLYYSLVIVAIQGVFFFFFFGYIKQKNN
jgi:hypothetical protein